MIFIAIGPVSLPWSVQVLMTFAHVGTKNHVDHPQSAKVLLSISYGRFQDCAEITKCRGRSIENFCMIEAVICR